MPIKKLGQEYFLELTTIPRLTKGISPVLEHSGKFVCYRPRKKQSRRVCRGFSSQSVTNISTA
ncbi:unnamed protein product [Hymenolepis diminuta]|uniref:Uncharacterized protein n=1 Tax=Hymenolepis diminuta TaxID=6216 RepID=A0A564Y040_HYMDI|nr:unnamed protein product [Hymenolepis diminuta]VUZ40665.1 unnamed protein product [Hymenolepis diminuta]